MKDDKKESWVTVNPNGSVTVKLTRPKEINGATIAELTLREPTVEDHVISNAAKGTELDKEVSLFANLCEVAPSDLRKLPMRDYMRLQAAYTANFFD